MKTLLVISGLLTSITLAADAPDRAVMQDSVSQDQLRAATLKLKQEITALIAEYSQFPAAAKEVEALRHTAESLDKVTSSDMPAVVDILREAGRSVDSAQKSKLIGDATGSQDSIRFALQSLADKLSQKTAQAAMQKRLETLMVRQRLNQQVTGELSAQLGKPLEYPELWKAEYLKTKDDQLLLERETSVASDALAEIDQDPNPEVPKHLKAAAVTSKSQSLAQNSKQAAAEIASAQRLEFSVVKQVEVIKTFKAIISILDSVKTTEERLHDIAGDLGELAKTEELLAQRTPRLSESGQTQASRDQLLVACRLELIMDRLAKQNAILTKRAATAIGTAREISRILKTHDFRMDAGQVSDTAADQEDLAANLADMARVLQKLADGVPVEIKESQLSKEEKAITDAIRTLTNAQQKIEDARTENRDKRNPKSEIKEAEAEIEKAREEMKGAAEATDPALDEKLQKAQDHNKIAESNKEVEHNLYHAKANVNDVIESLKESAQKMAAEGKQGQEGKEGAQAQQGKEGKDGQGGDSQQMGTTGKGEGTSLAGVPGGPALNRVSAEGKASDAKREALTILGREKAAPEYEERVNQYLKNLAENPDGL